MALRGWNLTVLFHSECGPSYEQHFNAPKAKTADEAAAAVAAVYPSAKYDITSVTPAGVTTAVPASAA